MIFYLFPRSGWSMINEGLTSWESNGLMSDFINIYASTRYFKHVIRLNKQTKNYLILYKLDQCSIIL